MVYKIACCLCIVCPPATVFEIIYCSATVYSQYVKTLRMRQKHTKFYCHDCRTAARPMTYTLTANEDDVSQALTEQQDPHSY